MLTLHSIITTGTRALHPRLQRPVKDIVVLESLPNKQVTEELAEIRVVRLVVESKRAAIVEIDGKFMGETSTQDFGRSGHFCRRQSALEDILCTSLTLLHNAVILLLLGSSLQTLPRKLATEEVLTKY